MFVEYLLYLFIALVLSNVVLWFGYKRFITYDHYTAEQKEDLHLTEGLQKLNEIKPELIEIAPNTFLANGAEIPKSRYPELFKILDKDNSYIVRGL